MPSAVRPVQPATCDALSPSTAVATLPSKASAILGGGVSALDRIRSDQAGATASLSNAGLTMQAAAQPSGTGGMVWGARLEPGAGPPLANASGPGVTCSRFALPRVASAIAPGRGLPNGNGPMGSGEDFLQTKRLAVSRTAFDRQWERVSHTRLSPRVLTHDATLRRLSRGGAGMAGVEAVNAWANRRIKFTEDAKLYGTADYWAAAQSTLKLRAGDCEDIAIAKMQLLAAMGVARSNMYLTIARDLARRADHALLIVKMDGRHWVLDNSTDRVLDANASYDYQPVFSFSEGHKWLHGATLASR